MGNIFAGSEVIEIGIQIEKNGRDFYSSLASQSKNPSVAKVFSYLTGEEEKHIAVFQGILSKTERYEPQGLGADEYFAYMNSLASGYIFTQKDKGKEIAGKIKSEEEAVEMGIGFEKESIVFYEGIKGAVPDYDQKVIGQLIAQEESHLMQLLDLKGKLNLEKGNQI